jgi:hypothetical protein
MKMRYRFSNQFQPPLADITSFLPNLISHVAIISGRLAQGFLNKVFCDTKHALITM